MNLSAIKRSDRGGVERPRESERHHKEQIAVKWNVRVNLSALTFGAGDHNSQFSGGRGHPLRSRIEQFKPVRVRVGRAGIKDHLIGVGLQCERVGGRLSQEFSGVARRAKAKTKNFRRQGLENLRRHSR